VTYFPFKLTAISEISIIFLKNADEGLGLPQYKDWNYALRVYEGEQGIEEYSISFYRRDNEWYDEIRYDSHDIRGGRKHKRPHLHIKIKSGFKDPQRGVEEIKEIIEAFLPNLRRVSER
jgi:hypothetical protein